MQKFENREQMNEYVKKENQRLEERKKKVKEIVSNTDFINWLQEFTSKYPSFTDDFINNITISKLNKEYLSKLSLFFEAIYNYAHDNYIYSLSDSDFIKVYRIKYNNIGYEIGLFTGHESYIFCKRVNEIDDTFIDFNYIMLNKKQDNTELIEKRLTELSNIITYFYEQNIPLKAIKSTTNDTIWKIEEKNQKSNKVLRK